MTLRKSLQQKMIELFSGTLHWDPLETLLGTFRDPSGNLQGLLGTVRDPPRTLQPEKDFLENFIPKWYTI